TWPAPRITIFKAETRVKKHAFYADSRPESVFFSPGENSERFQLAVQVRALETASFGDARYGAVYLREMMLEVGSLEGLAGLAQGEIERQIGLCGAACELRQHPFRVRDTYLLLRGERHQLHVALFGARCEKRQVLLLVPGQHREFPDEQHAAGDLLQQILGRFVEGVRRIYPGRVGLLQIARIELRHHTSFAAQQ